MLFGLLALPAQAGAQEPVEPGHTVLTAVPVTPGEPVSGELSTPTEEDWYRVEVERPLMSLRIEIQRTNDECEAWTRLVSLDGLVLGQVIAASYETRSIDVVVPASGPYFLAVDHGPTATCAGASYSFTVTLADAGRSLQAPRSATPRAGRSISRYLSCQMWSTRANSLIIAIHRTARAARHAHGKRRRRLLRKLHQLQRQYREARREQHAWCG